MTTTKVCLIDYGACNLGSLEKSVHDLTPDVTIQVKPVSSGFTHYILPGVGSFSSAYQRLRQLGWNEALKDIVSGNGKLLGICLGMQLLASYGDEGGGCEGFGFIPGNVKLLKPGKNEQVPHVGWNSVKYNKEHPLFSGIENGSDFYFVHGYHFIPNESTHALAVTDYSGGFVSVVGDKYVTGVQFHPEKSSRAGKRVIQNFLNIC